ncbi:MAG TPA: trehalose-phosphatase [Steroidobacter sp.]|jgi:trehalose 6-phosphate phosphatase|nr:trehalose-phosphatase [Steroidobacteraceae bacterium]HLS80964.1 trehalose-phosphatase [Steroidobacter sp.]
MLSNNAVADYAFFLDVDGTLLEIAATPQAVHVSERLKTLLNELSVRLQGALALVSGRSVSDLDALFSPARFCAAGVHGCERRTASGALLQPEVDEVGVALARAELAEFIRGHEGLLLEDKGYGVALHYRLAPHMQEEVLRRMTSLLERLGPGFELQAGKCVYELRPANWNKGAAVSAFMQEAPFRGRQPVYVGDDVTDESAFAAANALGGISVRVGKPAPTAARYALHSVLEVHRWLEKAPPPRMEDLRAIG